MSITLKNITAADTISSMADKINFNFDQLILNGGGIEGPRGVEGYPGMQGIIGNTGLQGPQGDEGERGTHFHILSLSEIEYAQQYGLGSEDPDGDEYRDGDMIIALVPKGDGTTANYTDSIWKVEWRDETTTPQASNDPDFYPTNDDNIIFSQTTHFNEISKGSGNSLLRTAPIDNTNKRGLVLNDYSNNISSNSISLTQLNDIINNNIVLVYTEALSESNNSGSPNCGIVFFKNGETSKEIGDFPRINYIVSPNEDVNYLNITSPQQGLRISANQDIVVSSELNNIMISTHNRGLIKLSQYDSEQNENVYVQIKETNNVRQLHLGSNEILIGAEIENPTKQWLAFRDAENDEDTSTSFEIELLKDNTFVKSNKLFSIGKSGAETLETSNISDYYNQARITADNTNTTPSLKLIAKEVSIGNDIEENSGLNAFGASIKQDKISIYSKYSDERYSGIEINSNDDKNENIHLKTSYPGVTKISNVSEEYEDYLINYNTGINFSSNKFYTAPMSSGIVKSGRYNYARCNFYQNMKIRNVNNMGAVHAGSIKFTGNYGSDTTTTMYDKITYNFVRIGNIVHCNFSGIINTNKICARETSNIEYEDNITPLSDYNESQLRGTGSIITVWPTANKVSSSNLPTYISTESSFILSSSSFTPVISLVSLNKIYLDLYPPIIKLTQSGSAFKTNVKNLIGHLTYSTGGAIYEKSLSYNDTITSLKIPAITISDMKNSVSSSGKVIVNPILSTDFTINGSTTTNLVELYGEFSYILDCESDDMHKQIDQTTTNNTNTYSSITENSVTNGTIHVNDGGNQNSATEGINNNPVDLGDINLP